MSFLLQQDQLPALQSQLGKLGWLQPHELLEGAEVPGAGNMNYTLRIFTNQRTFILKQARAYVEKYPQIPAPRERALIEGQYYDFMAREGALRHYVPALLGIDQADYMLMLEDLGPSSDFTYLYEPEQQLREEQLRPLMRYLSLLHDAFSLKDEAAPITNRAMRALNAQHIFEYPLMENNGFDLDTVQPGLQAVASVYQADEALKAKAQALSQHYLHDGHHLLHGDYYPGSWLSTKEGPKIIDPEFCFFGPREFDLGVMLAHFKMAAQPAELLQQAQDLYEGPIQDALLEAFVGIELIRRIIGLAQLPLSIGLETRTDLLKEGYEAVMRFQDA